MENNMLIIHGGAPTAVMNASLYGAVMEAKDSGKVAAVLGARGGALGVLREDFIRLDNIPEYALRGLLRTPASAIGTSRDHLKPEDYGQMARVLRERHIGYVLYNGGNGSMDACGKLARACAGAGICVVGIPKTIDNDLAVTDHAPGFGSAARYLAATVREVSEDVRSLPIHACVIEAMGRNAGWLAAASALARSGEGDGPHMILCPEAPFEEEAFLSEVERLARRHGGIVIVASEGLCHKDKKPVVEPVFRSGRSVYYGDVSAHLCSLIIRNLGIKARGEKPGICGRASIAWQSGVDRLEAELAGREAAKAALSGHTEVMVGFERRPGGGYRIVPRLIPIREVMLHERTLPKEYLAPGQMDVTKKYLDWCRPLVGELPDDFFRITA